MGILRQVMDVKAEEIQDLLEYFSKNKYKAKDTDPKIHHVMERCLGLFGLDYNFSIISNQNGELSTSYPSSLVILEGEKTLDDCNFASGLNGEFHLPSLNISNGGKGNGVHSSIETSSISTRVTCLNTSQDSNVEVKIKDLFNKARFARCRARFPVPVILYNNRHICRSATLSGGPEIYGRSSFDYFFSGGTDYKLLEPDPGDDEMVVPETQSDWQLFDRVRSQDIRLLKAFQVHTIVDLMVEKKKVKFGMNVTSSEKVDKEHRYSEFNLISLPYPGCEFFKQYRDNNYNGEELIFEWNQGHVDAEISVPVDETSAPLKLDWSQYRKWDLVHLTQNYMKLLLAYIKEGKEGVLIHCISGWDRTPLFISLIRLSLWADGVIHKSLNAEQILYLTLAYDWLLFGHNLVDRLSKGEEILFFCFYFLKHIVHSDFSVEVEDGNDDEPTNPVVLSTTRNDSDINLDGVLLDGDGDQTSPEGSNWSLNSCSSSQSSKSRDNPPTYFQVTHDSWEDCNGDQHLMMGRAIPVSNDSKAQAKSTNSSSISFHAVNGSNGTAQSPSHPIPLPIPKVGLSSSAKTSGNSNGSSSFSPVLPKGNFHAPVRQGRTSPVAVPVPNRNLQNRTESNSSASIGSWQLITGTGSLRDAISTSDPGSNYSHASRSSINDAMDCIEASESSCTLVEELTPMNSNPNSSPISNGMGCWRSSKIIEDELRDDNVFLPPSLNQILEDDDDPIIEGGVSPTEVFTHNENSRPLTCRRDRLAAVRKHFYSLYSTSIGLQSRHNVNDTSSGFSILFGNIATKVGIRAPTRNTS